MMRQKNRGPQRQSSALQGVDWGKTMEPERWKEIELLYHLALECEESRRAEFLEQACGGDEALRREVESLLAYE